MKQIYSDATQMMNSVSVQKMKFIFISVSANFTDSKDLRYWQLHVFVMQYYSEILKKLSEKNLLTKSRIMIDTAKLHKMTDLIT